MLIIQFLWETVLFLFYHPPKGLREPVLGSSTFLPKNCLTLQFRESMKCFFKLLGIPLAIIGLLLLLLSRFSRVWLCATPQRAAHQAPPSLGFFRQEHWSGLPFPSPMHESEKWKWSRSVVSNSLRPHGLQPTRLLRPWDFPGKSTRVGCNCLLQNKYAFPLNNLALEKNSHFEENISKIHKWDTA